MDARSARENAQLRAKFYQMLSFLVLASEIQVQVYFDSAGATMAVRERHDVDDDGGMEWERYIPFSSFEKVDPQSLALSVQHYRNEVAGRLGWDLRNTKGVVEET